MGSIFRRGNKLWIKYKNVAGKWINKPSGLDIGQEQQVKVLLKKTEANVRVRIEAGETEKEGPLTVEKYAERWLATREARGLTSASEDRGGCGSTSKRLSARCRSMRFARGTYAI
jgi:hypothetical protein